jgi:hypothetical protein
MEPEDEPHTLEDGVSTIPGPESWADAGLVEPPLAQPVELPEEPEEYLPPEPRPDLAGEAEEADVAEQAEEVPDDDVDDYR